MLDAAWRMAHALPMPPAPEPAWQKWLLPEVPGLRQFAIGAVAILLPLPAVLFGPEQVIPAMAAGITLGVGLGLGWALLYARSWFRRAPISAMGVFAITFGCLLHVAVMPRWELLLRLKDARQQLGYFQLLRAANTTSEPPRYQRGQDEQRFAVVLGASGRAVVLYTPLPLRRWSLFGWRDNCWLILRANGEVETLWSATEWAAAMPPPATPALIPAPQPGPAPLDGPVIEPPTDPGIPVPPALPPADP